MDDDLPDELPLGLSDNEDVQSLHSAGDAMDQDDVLPDEVPLHAEEEAGTLVASSQQPTASIR